MASHASGHCLKHSFALPSRVGFASIYLTSKHSAEGRYAPLVFLPNLACFSLRSPSPTSSHSADKNEEPKKLCFVSYGSNWQARFELAISMCAEGVRDHTTLDIFSPMIQDPKLRRVGQLTVVSLPAEVSSTWLRPLWTVLFRGQTIFSSELKCPSTLGSFSFRAPPPPSPFFLSSVLLFPHHLTKVSAIL